MLMSTKRKSTERVPTKRRYRQQHPDYVRRNAAFVRKRRQQLRQVPVSPTSSDPDVTVGSEKSSDKVSL